MYGRLADDSLDDDARVYGLSAPHEGIIASLMIRVSTDACPRIGPLARVRRAEGVRPRPALPRGVSVFIDWQEGGRGAYQAGSWFVQGQAPL